MKNTVQSFMYTRVYVPTEGHEHPLLYIEASEDMQSVMRWSKELPRLDLWVRK